MITEGIKVQNVIIVDDDEGLLGLLAIRVKRLLGCEVTSASSYEEAIPLLQKNRYDLSIFDFALGSGHTGIDLFNETIADTRDKPAMLITGLSDPEIKKQASAVGFRELVLKTEHFFTDLAEALRRLGFQTTVS